MLLDARSALLVQLALVSKVVGEKLGTRLVVLGTSKLKLVASVKVALVEGRGPML